MDRLILIQSVEAARCLEEKLLSRALDGDVGSLLGWGYLAFRGGPLAWIDTYGIDKFVATCEALARSHPRYAPSKFLKNLAASGKGIMTVSSYLTGSTGGLHGTNMPG
jgi:3-hydroxyacyl-CoA dehydrogenase / enoyl-CoA hydratase / 3-hydroxybutyryl-CoA epimerase